MKIEQPNKRVRRKRTAYEWYRPKGQHDAPTLTAQAAAKRLQFSNTESVHILVRRGPENRGLPGYIPGPDGEGWVRKEGPGYNGTQVMFYPEDIETWAQKHPLVQREPRRVPYTEEQKTKIIAEADALKNADGTVTRTRVYSRLAQKYGVREWNTRTYKVIKQVLDDAGYPLPAQMPRDTGRRHKAV